jgi:hypothetical protein
MHSLKRREIRRILECAMLSGAVFPAGRRILRAAKTEPRRSALGPPPRQRKRKASG